MSNPREKWSRVRVWSEAPESFDGGGEPAPVWHVAVEEFRAYIRGNTWEIATMLVTHAKTKREAAKEAAKLLRQWTKALAAEAKEST